MKTTKEMRQHFRQAADGFLITDPQTMNQIMDDLDRCEQLERVAKDLAESLKYALHYVPQDIITAVPVMGDDKPCYMHEPNVRLVDAQRALAQYNQLVGGADV